MPFTPSSKPFPYQHPHIPSRHMGRAVFTTASVDIDLKIGHNNVIMNGMPIITSRGSGNQAVTVEGGINRNRLKKGVLTFTQKKSDGTDAAPTAGSTSGGTGPFNVTAGQTTKFKIDGGSAQTKTWAGTGGSITSSGATYASLDTKTLDFTNAGYAALALTVTFDNTCTDRATTITYLNTQFGLVSAPLIATAGSGSEIVISSTKKGTSATVTINPSAGASTALAAMGFSAGQSGSGSGDAADLSAVTRAEAAAALAAAISGASFSGSGSNITATSNTTSATSSVQLDASSTQTLGFDTSLHSGVGGPLTIEWSCEVFDPVPV